MLAFFRVKNKEGEMTEKQLQNLVQNNERTPNERREIAKKAGKASGVSRRKSKSIREALKALLSGKAEYNGELMLGNDAIALSVFNKALNGDVQAFKEIRDTVGEKPVDRVEANVKTESQELLKEYLEQAKGGKLRQ